MTELSSIPADFAPPEGFLRGRTVLITGASAGLGEALALACARHAAVVILAARNVRKLERLHDRVVAAGDPQPVIYPVDLQGATAADFDAMAAAIAEQFPALDAVVHAAADFAGLTPLAHTDPASWHNALQVNLTAPFLLNQAVLGLLLQSDRARIIFTLDDPTRVAGAYWGAYGVSKWGLRALASICASELETYRIEVDAIVPPALATDLRRRAYLVEPGTPAAPPETAVAAYLYLLAEHSETLTGRVFCVPTQAATA